MEDKVLCLFLPLSSVGTGPNLLNNNFFPLSIQLFAANPFGVCPPNSDIIGGKPPDLQIAVGLKQATERATWKSPIFFSNCQALKGLQSIKSQGEIMALTRGWKIMIVGLIVFVIGWLVWGISALLLQVWFEYTLLFATTTFIGILITCFGNIVRYNEKRLKKMEQSKNE